MKSRGGAWKHRLPLWRWSSGNKQLRTSSGPSHSGPGLWSTAKRENKTKHTRGADETTRRREHVENIHLEDELQWHAFSVPSNVVQNLGNLIVCSPFSTTELCQDWSLPPLSSALPHAKTCVLSWSFFSHHALVPRAELVMAGGCRGVTKTPFSDLREANQPLELLQHPQSNSMAFPKRDALVICDVISLVSSKGLTKFE